MYLEHSLDTGLSRMKVTVLYEERWYKGRYQCFMLDRFKRKVLVEAGEDIPFEGYDVCIPKGQRFVTVVRLLWRNKKGAVSNV